ncbi:MAG: DUF1659 domain-containing protein [Syntrophomonadaceae bacterium]|jgi:hypothetical protein
MAVVSTPISSELILVMDNGTGASGQALTISRRYANVIWSLCPAICRDLCGGSVGY